MTDDLRFFLPIAKIDEDKRTISGYASTEAKDSDGEVVSLDAIKAALPDYMTWGNIREMHRLSAIGTAEEAHVDKKGLWLTAKISDDGAWQKVVDKVYKGFSIGGRKISKVADKIVEMAMTEISIVDRPANSECRFAIAKMEKGAVEFEPGAELRKPKKSKLEKLANSFAQVSEFLHDPNGQILPFVKTIDGKPPFEEPKPGNSPLDDANKPIDKDASSSDKVCKKHGVASCEVCKTKKAAKLAKRKFTAEQRRTETAAGNAMSDGSFPIKTQKDLDNAWGLRGNSNHSKSSVEAHIRAMAAKHGLKMPEDESTAKISKSSSPEPSFLNLKAGEKDAGRVNSALPARLELGKPRKGGALAKRMTTAGSLSYCFDSIRDASRSLLLEAKAEGGDMKDKALAKQLGSAAQILATVIGQKAAHEGQEALDFSDVDDRFIRDLLGEDFEMAQLSEGLAKVTTNGDPIETAVLNLMKRAAQPTRAMRMESMNKNLKKASASRKEACKAIEAVHKMIKAAYIAKMEKAAKKKPDADADDDGFDSADAMDKLAAAFGELGKVATFSKAARMQLKKMASRSGETQQEPTHGNPFYTVPSGVKDLSPSELATAGPGSKGGGSEPPLQALDKEWAGKVAKAAGSDGRIDAGTAALLVKNAQLETQNEFLSRSATAVRSPGTRPYNFDLTKVAGNGNNGAARGDPIMKAIQDSGVSLSQLENDETARGKVIGTYMMDATNGKSVLDPAFRGTAGLRR